MRTRSAIAMALVVVSVSMVRAAQDIGQRLQEADRLAWLNDWYGALPVYVEAEQAATSTGDRRDAMYAKFGRLRGEMQTRSLAETSDEIGSDLRSLIAKQDPRLRLRGLTVKGDIDLEWDVDAAQDDWQQVQQLAKELGDTGWEHRATGELAMVAFMKGNTGDAGTRIQQVLQAVTQSGDLGGQVRYLGAIANGLLLAGYPSPAMGYVDRALKLATDHPETGFPFAVYSTKVLALLAVNKSDEAEQFAKTAMTEAQAGDRRIKEIELLMLLAKIAEKRNQHDRAAEYLEQAITKARTGHVQRLLADAEEGVAGIYRARGALDEASRHAVAAVTATETTGNRFMLPVRLGVLADIYGAQGRLADADQVYDQATDVVEGIMVNVPSREAQARLIGVMSDLYTGHFRLAAERLGAPVKAYEIIERARGRAVADVLRQLPGSDRPTETAGDRFRTISRLQVRLMKASRPTERKQVLNALWEAEQRSTLSAEPRVNLLMAKSRVAIKTIQQSLAADEVILEYVLTEPRSYCLVISRAELKLVPLPSRKQIESLAERFTEQLRSGTIGRSSVAKELFDAVLQPIAQWQTTKRMFIVPDGKLHLLPFDSLLTLNAASPHIVTLVPSANVWYLLRTRPRRTAPERSLLAVGGVPYDRMFAGAPMLASVMRPDETRGLFDASYPSKLSPLPSAEGEVLAAARSLGPSSVVLTGDQATETALKAQKLGQFEILHFAVHAFADPNFPERAALVMLNDAAAGNDGLLQPREIARFTLNASVVVLSACDTAVGPVVGQEGVLNIARAFLVAGAHSVITTLWTVSDTTSTALMRRFYENITAGQDIAEALMRSKATVLEQFGPKALPTVAAFQLVGVGDRRIAFKTPPRIAADTAHETPTAH